MLSQKTQFVPITTLKLNLSVDNLKEAAPAQPVRIFPLKYGPVFVLKQVFGFRVDPERPASDIAYHSLIKGCFRPEAGIENQAPSEG